MTSFNKVPKGYQNEGNQPKRSGVYLGVVRKNIDSQRMGRFLVWISDFGPDVEEYWVPVSYASPFAGATDVRDNDAGDKTQKGSQTAYGFWATPPDINNQLLCCFIDGDIANGFWFACIYQQNMNHMVPGIASHKPTADGGMDGEFPIGPPTVEYNKKRGDLGPTLTSKFEKDTMERPVFEPLASQLKKQGLNQDLVRGPSNASARRESPSMVFGLSTPKGHSLVIDDGEVSGAEPNEFIRMRTKSGVQLLIHETTGFIYMITKDGKTWVELNDQGIDMYSAGPISMNSDKDINIHAGGKVGIHGTTGVHIAGQKMTTYTAEDTTFFAEGDLIGYGTDVGFRANKNATLEAVKDVSLNAGKNILEGACGYASRNAKKILDNSGGAAPHEVDPHEYMKEVVNRVPTAEPYVDHFNSQGGGDPVDGFAPDGTPLTNVVGSDGTVTAVPANMPKAMQDRAKLLYQKLKARGYSDAQAAAIIGVFRQESSLNPGADEPGGGNGYGLAQWSDSGGRRDELIAYAKKKGKPVNDIDLQLDFMQHEMATSEKKAGDMMRNAKTVDQGLAAMKAYERYGVAGNRTSYAHGAYNDIKSGKYG